MIGGVPTGRRGPRRPIDVPPALRVMSVRIPIALGMVLDDCARTEGLTAGAITRRALVAHLDVAPTLAVPIRRYRPTRPVPRLDVVRLAELRAVAGELNGTLRQTAGLSRDAGAVAVWVEVEAVLPRLGSLIRALDEMKSDALRQPEQENAAK